MTLTPPQALEAVLFASGEPMAKKELESLRGVNAEELSEALRALSEALAGRGVTLVESEHALELRTAADAADIVKLLRESEFSRDLGKAGLEALAIILYREGATRSEVDWVRGVNSGATIRSLLLRGLVMRTEDPEDARKVRYVATPDALAHLGVSSIRELPRYAELAHEIRDAERAAETEDKHGPQE
ncbi:MAG: SMC-Scp complex subunit ScpB [Patescibacteria group bacterium]|nr:SMC-Scp complex subunit ScpB [Patescibacteria group bacterium]